MFETMVAFNMADHIFGHAFEPPKGPMGYSRVLTQSRRPHKTTDGYICLLAYTDPQWERFWAEVGRPELKDDRRFNSLSSRAENIEEVYRLAGDFIRKRTTSEWLEVLPRLEIPCGEIVELENIPDDPHLQAIGFFRQKVHHTEGKVTLPDVAVQFKRTPGSIERLQPRLGEHSREILREVGYADIEIDNMSTSGATNQSTETEE